MCSTEPVSAEFVPVADYLLDIDSTEVGSAELDPTEWVLVEFVPAVKRFLTSQNLYLRRS